MRTLRNLLTISFNDVSMTSVFTMQTFYFLIPAFYFTYLKMWGIALSNDIKTKFTCFAEG